VHNRRGSGRVWMKVSFALLLPLISFTSISALPSVAQATTTCLGESGPDGTSGRDNYSGDSGNNTWSGLGSADAADGKGGSDKLCGDDGTDGTSDALADWVGGGGADRLDGGADRDVLKGEDGNDDIYERFGAGVIYGGGGNDFLDAGSDSDADTIFCGGGSNDTVVSYFGDTYGDFSDCENFV
jgi:Ca2+-binding RTX toxin-like protein